MLEDPWKKQLVNHVCSINWIKDDLTLMLVEKGFFVKNMKDKPSHDIVVKWNELVKLLKIEKDKLEVNRRKTCIFNWLLWLNFICKQHL